MTPSHRLALNARTLLPHAGRREGEGSPCFLAQDGTCKALITLGTVRAWRGHEGLIQGSSMLPQWPDLCTHGDPQPCPLVGLGRYWKASAPEHHWDPSHRALVVRSTQDSWWP